MSYSSDSSLRSRRRPSNPNWVDDQDLARARDPFAKWKDIHGRTWRALPHLKNIYKQSQFRQSKITDVEYTAEWKHIVEIQHGTIDYNFGGGFGPFPNNQQECYCRLVIIEDVCTPLINQLLESPDWNVSPEMFEEHLAGADWTAEGHDATTLEPEEWNTRRIQKDYVSLRWFRPLRVKVVGEVDIHKRSVSVVDDDTLDLNDGEYFPVNSNIWRRHLDFRHDFRDGDWSSEQSMSRGLRDQDYIASQERATVWRGVIVDPLTKRDIETVLVLLDPGICGALRPATRIRPPEEVVRPQQFTYARTKDGGRVRLNAAGTLDKPAAMATAKPGDARHTGPQDPSGDAKEPKPMRTTADKMRHAARTWRAFSKADGETQGITTADEIATKRADKKPASPSIVEKTSLHSSDEIVRPASASSSETGKLSATSPKQIPTSDDTPLAKSDAVPEQPPSNTSNEKLSLKQNESKTSIVAKSPTDSVVAVSEISGSLTRGVSGEPGKPVRVDTMAAEGQNEEPGVRRDPKRPTFFKIALEHLQPDTLNLYKLPWSFADTGYLIIKQEISDDLLEELFDHTKKMKEEQQRRNRWVPDKDKSPILPEAAFQIEQPNIPTRRRPPFSNVASRAPLSTINIGQARANSWLRPSTTTMEDLLTWLHVAQGKEFADEGSIGPASQLFYIARNDTIDFISLANTYLDRAIALSSDENKVARNINFWRILINVLEAEFRKLSQTFVVFPKFSVTGKALHYGETEYSGMAGDRGAFNDTEQLKPQIFEIRKRLEMGLQSLVSAVQVIESRRGIAEAESVTKLTELAFIYIPLSFAASFFGMQVKELNPANTSIKWFVVMAVCVTATSYIFRLVVRSRLLIDVLHSTMSAARAESGIRENQPVPTTTFIWYASRALLILPVQHFQNTHLGRQFRKSWQYILGTFLCSFIPLFSVWFNGNLKGGMKLVISLAIVLTALLVLVGFAAMGLMLSYRPWLDKLRKKRRAEELRRQRQALWADDVDIIEPRA